MEPLITSDNLWTMFLSGDFASSPALCHSLFCSYTNRADSMTNEMDSVLHFIWVYDDNAYYKYVQQNLPVKEKAQAINQIPAELSGHNKLVKKKYNIFHHLFPSKLSVPFVLTNSACCAQPYGACQCKSK